MMKFNDGYLENYTLILSKKNHEHLGQITNVTNLVSKINMNSANEIAFNVNMPSVENDNVDKHFIEMWNNIIDFKYVYVKELNEYYEIQVETSEDEMLYKSVTGISACEAELSQIYIYGLEVNTDLDISRVDYKSPTIFYNSDNPKESLLNRALDKAPHYTIKYVDPTVAKMQRTFSCDGEDIYTFLTETVAPEFKCIFQFDTTDRSISVYDLQTRCLDCGERGDFSHECPKCKSKNLMQYGEDTTVLVDTENLAESIIYTTDKDSVKNCFKLEAGDDNINAAIANINPAGNNYIYYFSDTLKKDMSNELVKKLEDYDKLYNSSLIEYEKLSSEVYECIDKIVYYTSEMMPERKNEPTDAKKEVAKLTEQNLSPMALSSVKSSTSTTTVESALKNYAKIFIHSGKYKVTILNSSFEYEGIDQEDRNYGYWYGQLKLENWGDEEDNATTPHLRILVRDDYQEFLEQKIKKKLAIDNEDDGSVFDVLSIKDLTSFRKAIELYCLDRLTSFYEAIQSAIDILIEQDQANEGADFYETLYKPYKDKLDACQSEIDKRSATIKVYEDRLDVAEAAQSKIHLSLDIQNFMGDTLFKEFRSFTREQIYENSNYISDGLSNDEIFKKAKEFLEIAKKDIVKSSELQHSISGSLINFISMKEFEPLMEHFSISNFIRIKVDNKVYRLRMISYQIEFDENGMSTIDVEFSDLTKVKDGSTDLKDIINRTNSMASSYNYFKNQVLEQQNSNQILNSWIQDGLDLTNLKIVSTAKNQNVVYDKNGILIRTFDDILGQYSPEQMKLINSTLAITDDNWRTVKTAVGKFYYVDPSTGEKKTAYGINGEVLVGSLILGERLLIKNNDATLQFNGNGLILDSKHDLNGQYNDIINLKVDGKSVFYINKKGDLVISPTAHLGDKGTVDDYINSLSQDFKTLNVILSNDLSTIPTDSNGNNGNYSFCTSSVQIFYGSSDVTKQSIITHRASTGVQYSVVGNTITVTNLTADSGYVEVTATYDNGKIVAKKKFTIVKQKQGIQGQDGIPGNNGSNGKTSYFHIKYSNKPNPTVSSDITEIPSAYIGTYVDFTEADSTDPKKYTWSRFEGQKGENGIAGVNGIDGKTSYLHIAYANSQDGSVGFSVTDSANKLYIGQYTDFVLQDSVDYKRYSWTKIKGNDGLNGTNGQNAVLYQIISSTNVIKLTQNNVLQPANVTFNSVSRVGNSIVTTPFAGRFKIEESLNGSSYTTKYTSSVNESTKVWTPSSKDVVSIRCSLYMTDGKTLVDMQSVTILTDISQLTQKIVFDKLTDNGRLQGLFMQDSKLYINASYLSTGIITDKNGKFSLNMETGKAILNDGEFKGKIKGTTIDGGTISGATINGNTITGGTISGTSISGGSINGINITGSTITGSNISGGSITSNTTINVTTDLIVGNNIRLGVSNTSLKKIQFVDTYGEMFSLYGDPHTASAVIESKGDIEIANEAGAGIAFILDAISIYCDSMNLLANSKKIEIRGDLIFNGTKTRIYEQYYNGSNNLYLCADGYNAIYSYDNAVYYDGKYIDSNWTKGKFYPGASGVALGVSASSGRWYRLYAANACSISSDRRLKDDIVYFDDIPTTYSNKTLIEQFFNNLKPSSYKMKNDIYKRLNFGFIAQDVIEALKSVGLTAYDVDFVNHGRDKNGHIDENEMYGLVYEEFIALNTHMIQKNIKKITEQENHINMLEQEVKNLQSKLDAFINNNINIKTITKE